VSEERIRADVLIAGGGVAGLSCGLALADLGLRVAVFEAADHLGGRAASWPDGVTGDVIDIGPHVLSTEHRNFIALLRRLGTAEDVNWQPEPFITLFDQGRLLRMRSPRWPVPLHGLRNLPLVLRSVSLAELLSNTRVAWRAARLNEDDTAALDNIDALYFLLTHGVRQRFIDWFWTPACLALLNVPLQRCSAAALMRVFRLMLGRSGYHFGFPAIGLSALYADGSRAGIEAAGGRVATSTRVDRVELRDGRFQCLVLADGRRVHSSCAVLAVPPAALSALALPKLPTVAQRFESSPYVSTMLWFDRRITRECFWARVWTPRDLNLDFYDLANIRGLPDDAPSLIACNAIHAHEATQWHDDAIVHRTLAEIAEFAPAAREARLRHVVVHRIPMAVPCPLPGTESLRPPNATPIEGLWVAGDWTGTALPCSMESAARSGHLAAEQVAAWFGRPLAIAIAPPETTGAVALLRRRASPEPALAGP